MEKTVTLSPATDPQIQRVFTPKRKRSLLSFRRKRDLGWFAASLMMFSSGATALFFSVWLSYQHKAPFPRGPEIASAALPLALNPVAAPPTPLEEFAPPPAAPEKAVAPPAAVPTKSVAPPPAPAPRAAGVAAPSAAKSPRFVVLSGKEVFRTEADRGARFSVTPTSAQGERAVHLYFSFVEGTWGLCALDIREDLSRYSRVQFVFKGDGPANTLEFKLVDSDGTNVGEVWPRRTTKSGWTVVDLRLKDLAFLGGTDPVMDWTRVRRIYFAVSKRPGDAGGKGRVTIRGLSFS